jgi:AcrR family transcriptional regulator
MTDGRRAGSYPKGVERRKEILARALDVITERGVTRMSLRAVAAELNVSHAAILHYFSSLEELMLEVVAANDDGAQQWAHERERSTLLEELVAVAGRNVRSRGLLSAYTSLLAMSLEPTNELSHAFFRRRYAYGREVLARSIAATQGAGADAPAPAAVASLVMASFDGLQMQWLLDPALDLAESLRALAPIIGDAPSVFTEYQMSTVRALEETLDEHRAQTSA